MLVRVKAPNGKVTNMVVADELYVRILALCVEHDWNYSVEKKTVKIDNNRNV